MPSLVKKWQSIQKELEEEEKSSSSDEDRDQLNKKNIEDWKQQQLMTYVRMHFALLSYYCVFSRAFNECYLYSFPLL